MNNLKVTRKKQFIQQEISKADWYQTCRTLRALERRDDAKDFAEKQLATANASTSLDDPFREEYCGMLTRFLEFVQEEEYWEEQDALAHRMEQEIEELMTDPEGDENTAYRIQCLQADLHGYYAAKNAVISGDEWMPENPYEEGLG